MSEENNEDWKKDYLKDWWTRFVNRLQLTDDWSIRIIGLKMIQEPLTPENLLRILKCVEPSDFDLVKDDYEYKQKIRLHTKTILKNQAEVTFEQFEELQKYFKHYKETGTW